MTLEKFNLLSCVLADLFVKQMKKHLPASNMRGTASNGGWGLSEETQIHFIRIRCEKLWLRSLIWITWFWDISCNLLAKREVLTNLSAACCRDAVLWGLVLAFHNFSGINTNNIIYYSIYREITLKEDRKQFWNPRNFWGWANMFPAHNSEQPKAWGGIGILSAVRDVSDNKC